MSIALSRFKRTSVKPAVCIAITNTVKVKMIWMETPNSGLRLCEIRKYVPSERRGKRNPSGLTPPLCERQPPSHQVLRNNGGSFPGKVSLSGQSIQPGPIFL